MRNVRRRMLGTLIILTSGLYIYYNPSDRPTISFMISFAPP